MGRGALIGRTLAAVLAACLALGLVGTSTAAADDASLYRAWTSRDAQAEKLIRAMGRGIARARRTNGRRVRGGLRAIRRLARLSRKVRADVAAETPSSDAGRKAKYHSLRTFFFVRRTLRESAAELRAAHAGRFRAANRHARRADRFARGWNRQVRRADRAFRRAGQHRKAAAAPSPLA